MLLIADSSLSDYEKEEREVRRLLRKPKKNAPRYDIRRNRMKVEDEDIQNPATVKADEDLSLNFKVIGGSDLSHIITKIAQDPPESEKKKNPSIEEKHDWAQAEIDKKLKIVHAMIKKVSEPLAQQFIEYTTKKYLEPFKASVTDDGSNLIKYLDDAKSTLNASAKQIKASLATDDIADVIKDNWPDPTDLEPWWFKAPIIAAIKSVLNELKIPDIIKAMFKKYQGYNDKQLVDELIKKEQFNDLTTNDLKSGSITEADAVKFTKLSAAFTEISKNIDASTDEIIKSMSDTSDRFMYALNYIAEVNEFMKSWNETMKNAVQLFKKYERLEEDIEDDEEEDLLAKRSKELDKIEGMINESSASLDELSKRRSDVDFETYIDGFREYMQSKYGQAPREVTKMLDNLRMASASNKPSNIGVVSAKIASYFGVVDQGHTSGPTNTEYLSFDKRYFGKKHYDSILKHANHYLNSDWIKYGWDLPDESNDSKFRAALDLAIHMADNNLYQSKIDAATYDMLLNRLANWSHDSFSETVYARKPGNKRSVKMSAADVKSIVRVANELKDSNPRASLDLMRSVASLLTKQALVEESCMTHDKPLSSPPSAASADGATAAEGEEMSMKDLEKSKKELKDALSAENIEDFLDSWEKAVKAMPKEIQKMSSITNAPEVRFGDLVRIAHEHPEVREVLVPVIFAAKKKYDEDKKKKKTKKKQKKDSKLETKTASVFEITWD